MTDRTLAATATVRPPRAPRAPRPARAPAPALPSLSALDRTHHQMLDVLTQLEALPAALDAHGLTQAARQTARAACGFFAKHARQHHADEEALVFPALIRGGDAELVQQVLRLQQDHGWLEEDWLQLEPQLQAVAEGYSWYEPELLREALGVFAALYREHIALEESLVYPAARRQMADEAESRAQRISQAALPPAV